MSDAREARYTTHGSASPVAIATVLAVCGFGSAMGLRALDPIVPRLSEAFGSSPRGAAFAGSAFALAYGVGQLGAGPLADRFGRRRVLALALLGVAVGSVLCGLAATLDQLVAARITAGLCAATVVPSSLALLSQLFAPADRGPAIARFMTAVLTGQLLGAVLMGWAEPRMGPLPVFGVLAAVPLLGVLLLARADAPVLHARSEGGLAAHVGAIMRRTPLPLLGAFGFAEGVLVFGAVPFVAVAMRDSFDGGSDAASLAVAAFALGGIAFAALVRPLMALLGRAVFPAGAAFGALAMAVLPRAGSAPVAALCMLGLGVGFYGMHNALQTAAAGAYPPARATAMALFSFAFFIGQGVGPLVFGNAAAITGGGGTTFAAFAGALLTVGLVGRVLLVRTLSTKW